MALSFLARRFPNSPTDLPLRTQRLPHNSFVKTNLPLSYTHRRIYQRNNRNPHEMKNLQKIGWGEGVAPPVLTTHSPVLFWNYPAREVSPAMCAKITSSAESLGQHVDLRQTRKSTTRHLKP